jgi:hypothetical protein
LLSPVAFATDSTSSALFKTILLAHGLTNDATL